MSNAKRIADGIWEAYGYTSTGNENASELLSRAIRALSETAEYDETASGLYGQLSEIDSLLNDFNRELAEYGKTCEFSEEELYETENRLNEINHLKTKYGNEIESILEYCKKQEERIALLEDYDQYVEDLSLRCRKAEEELKKASLKLSKIRKKQAGLLETEIEEGLRN